VGGAGTKNLVGLLASASNGEAIASAKSTTRTRTHTNTHKHTLVASQQFVHVWFVFSGRTLKSSPQFQDRNQLAPEQIGSFLGANVSK